MCLTRHIGKGGKGDKGDKGGKGNLEKLHEVKQNLEIVKTHVLKEDIESAMFAHNAKHCTVAHDAAIHNNKTHGQLQNDSIRNKILDGNLKRADCDNEEVHQFLSLLKQPRYMRSAEIGNMKKINRISGYKKSKELRREVPPQSSPSTHMLHANVH